MPTLPRATSSVLATLLLAGHAVGQVTWDGDAGDMLWFTGANWSTDQTPGADDRVIIGSGAGEVRAAGQLVEASGVNIQSALFLDNTDMVLNTFSSDISNLRVENTILRHIITNGELRLYGSHAFRNHGIEFRKAAGSNGDVTFFDAQVDECTRMVTRDCTTFLFSGRFTVSQSLDALGGGQFIQSNATVELLDGAAINGAYTMFDGGAGTLTMLEQGVCNINGPFTGRWGTIDARGEMHFNNDFTIDGTALAASGNGSVGFFGGSAQRTFRPRSITGDGTIEATASPLLIPADFTTSITGQYGLVLSGDVTNNATITSDGTLTLSGARLSGSGAIQSTGTLELLGSTRLDVPITIAAGQTHVRTSLGVNALFDVQPGAAAIFHTGLTIQRSPGSTTGQIHLRGNTELPDTLLDSDQVRLEEPAALGGTLAVYRGKFVVRRDTTWTDVQAQVLTEAASAIHLFGGSGTFHTFDGDSTFFGSGSVLAGSPVLGERPTLIINGTVVSNVAPAASNHAPFVLDCQTLGPGLMLNFGVMQAKSAAGIGAALENNGDLTFISPTIRATITNNNGGVARGSALFDGGSIVNAGSWQAFTGGSLGVTPNAGLFRNEGSFVVDALSGSPFSYTVDATFDNVGQVRVTAADLWVNHVLNIDASIFDGGHWAVTDNGHIYFAQLFSSLSGPGTEMTGNGTSIPRLRDVTRVEDGASVTYDGNTNVASLTLDRGHAIVAEGTLNAAGAVSAQNGSRIEVQSGGTLQSSSNITVGSESQPSIIDDLDGVVTLALPRGTPPPTIIAPQIDIYGRLTPSAAGYGSMNMAANLILHDSAQCVIDAESAASHDTLQIAGAAHLAGTLTFSTVPEYTPLLNDTIVFLTTTDGVTGAFATLDAPALPGNIAWMIGSDASSVWVRVEQLCRPDLNRDATLDFFDVQMFLGLYASGDDAADFNADATLDFFDVQLFLSLYAQGCP